MARACAGGEVVADFAAIWVSLPLALPLARGGVLEVAVFAAVAQEVGAGPEKEVSLCSKPAGIPG